MTDSPISADRLRAVVDRELASIPFIDLHTHLFMPSLGAVGLWGIDELITYHYLEAELFRFSTVKPAEYFTLSKTAKADLIWKTLFVENTPASEATRGVIAVLKAFNLPTSGDLKEARAFFASRKLDAHIKDVFRLAGISECVMTNDPLDPEEAPMWERGAAPDSQFHAVLRLDRILNKWDQHWQVLQSQGYDVAADGSGKTASEVRRFIHRWAGIMNPVYMACSLPDTFMYPEDSLRVRFFREAVLPACREIGIPMSIMIGVRYLVNPALRLAGDAVGKAELRAVERLCVDFPDNRFLISVLSRENQHELTVYARKFANLMPFGCWWFLNNPSIVEEMTRERIEMLGMSFVPQHSDARVLEQVIYKWRNTRRTLGPILTNTYQLLSEDGRGVTVEEIRRDITKLFRG
ncbi:MAG: glucuronate isomerase, partial [Acidobacteriota bacterium]|nr:glucuronate isomerase [Acidobacteriota bacterium]